jgi:colanic acid/amylovoran biosynthesis glycosyltransferase
MSENGKRLLIISSTFPFGIGEEFLETEIQGLLNQGFEIYISPLRRSGEIRDSSVLNDVNLVLLNYLQLDVLKLIKAFSRVWVSSKNEERISIREFLLRFGKESLAASLSTQLSRRLSETPVKHIHAYWASSASTLAMQTSKICNIPWSFSAHSGDIVEGLNLIEKASTSKRIRFSSSKGSAIFQKKTNKFFEYSVIRHGVFDVSQNNWEPQKRASPLRVVCVANLIEIKGHRYLFEALAILKAGGTIINLSLIGQGPLESELTELRDNLDLNGQINFLGYLPQSHLFQLYANRSFDLMVLPSVTAASGQQEGTPVSLIEAASFGIPLISTNTGGISDLVPIDSGALVTSGDAQVLANAIQEYCLMNDDEYRARSSTFQTFVVSKFDASVTSVEFAAFLFPGN